MNAPSAALDGMPAIRQFDGLQAYEPMLDAMQAHASAIRQEGAEETIWLLEHAPVYTGGTSAKDADLLNPAGVPTHMTGRGGQWTYHGPGQRIAYVMLDLNKRSPDVRAFVHGLEGWIIDAIGEFGIIGERRDGLPGIWVKTGQSLSGMDKIAAIGVRISKWVTWHGIAINLDPNLVAFDAIVPCGVRDGGVTSLATLGVTTSMADLDAALIKHFSAHF